VRPVSRAVDRLLRGLGIAAEVDRAAALDHWAATITAVLGPDASATRAIAVDGATLIVAVPNSAWAAEIRLHERAILDSLRRASPKSGITAIRSIPTRSDPRPG
jgi:predicted nucleic acid-binding Zn ribbon protein